MTYLVDTNVLLEAGLKRALWEQATAFLSQVPSDQLAVTDFSLHSLGFYLWKRTPELFDAMIKDVLDRDIRVLSIDPTRLSAVIAASKSHRLDFDDAFIYVTADIYDLSIVSFDSDFDHTPRGRKTPAAVLLSLDAG